MELKNCPFCDGCPITTHQGAMFNGYGFAIVCTRCGAQSEYRPTEEEAAEAWNSRTERTARRVNHSGSWFMCSACGYEEFEVIDPDYCPNCGARIVFK